MLTNNKIAANWRVQYNQPYPTNAENCGLYFDTIPNLPPKYTGITAVVMPKPKISIPQHPHLL